MSEAAPDQHGQENLELITRIAGIGSVVCLAGAGLAYATGDEVSGGWRTHMDAFFVLGTLGAALMLVALAVGREMAIRREPTGGRSHYE